MSSSSSPVLSPFGGSFGSGGPSSPFSISPLSGPMNLIQRTKTMQKLDRFVLDRSDSHSRTTFNLANSPGGAKSPGSSNSLEKTVLMRKKRNLARKKFASSDEEDGDEAAGDEDKENEIENKQRRRQQRQRDEENEEEGDNEEDSKSQLLIKKKKSDGIFGGSIGWKLLLWVSKARHRAKMKRYREIQQRVKAFAEKEGIVTTLQSASASPVPKWMQGDLEMYSADKLRMRTELERSPAIQEAIEKWWKLIPKNKKQKVPKAAFKWMDKRLYDLLVICGTPEEAESCAEQDWAHDSEGKKALNYKRFCRSVYEMVDIWVDSVEEYDYEEFLNDHCDLIFDPDEVAQCKLEVEAEERREERERREQEKLRKLKEAKEKKKKERAERKKKDVGGDNDADDDKKNRRRLKKQFGEDEEEEEKGQRIFSQDKVLSRLGYRFLDKKTARSKSPQWNKSEKKEIYFRPPPSPENKYNRALELVEASRSSRGEKQIMIITSLRRAPDGSQFVTVRRDEGVQEIEEEEEDFELGPEFVPEPYERGKLDESFIEIKRRIVGSLNKKPQQRQKQTKRTNTNNNSNNKTERENRSGRTSPSIYAPSSSSAVSAISSYDFEYSRSNLHSAASSSVGYPPKFKDDEEDDDFQEENENASNRKQDEEEQEEAEERNSIEEEILPKRKPSLPPLNTSSNGNNNSSNQAFNLLPLIDSARLSDLNKTATSTTRTSTTRTTTKSKSAQPTQRSTSSRPQTQSFYSYFSSSAEEEDDDNDEDENEAQDSEQERKDAAIDQILLERKQIKTVDLSTHLKKRIYLSLSDANNLEKEKRQKEKFFKEIFRNSKERHKQQERAMRKRSTTLESVIAENQVKSREPNASFYHLSQYIEQLNDRASVASIINPNKGPNIPFNKMSQKQIEELARIRSRNRSEASFRKEFGESPLPTATTNFRSVSALSNKK